MTTQLTPCPRCASIDVHLIPALDLGAICHCRECNEVWKCTEDGRILTTMATSKTKPRSTKKRAVTRKGTIKKRT